MERVPKNEERDASGDVGERRGANADTRKAMSEMRRASSPKRMAKGLRAGKRGARDERPGDLAMLEKRTAIVRGAIGESRRVMCGRRAIFVPMIEPSKRYSTHLGKIGYAYSCNCRARNACQCFPCATNNNLRVESDAGYPIV